MEIIFGRENAEKLRDRYTVLDLEIVTVETDNGPEPLEVFCLIPADKISFTDLPNLADWVKVHNEFLKAYKDQDYTHTRTLAGMLMGQFGGEVDSFYDEILKRIADK